MRLLLGDIEEKVFLPSVVFYRGRVVRPSGVVVLGDEGVGVVERFDGRGLACPRRVVLSRL